jgi:hypothetical protein
MSSIVSFQMTMLRRLAEDDLAEHHDKDRATRAGAVSLVVIEALILFLRHSKDAR